MPIYNYECRRHGEFSTWANLADFDRAVACPICSKPARRSVSAAYLGMNSQLRKAFGSSEKSAHEPRVVHRRRGDPIPSHDVHKDLAQRGGRGNAVAHSHGGHTHSTGSEHTRTVRSRHPWLVRH